MKSSNRRDPLLDETLGGGGIMTRSITEIVGESSAGKTQLCLQLCLTVQLPRHLGGLDGSVVWLSTEGKFAYTRLEAMIPSFLAKYSDAGTDLTPESIRENIFFDALADQETQLHVFNYQLPILIEDTHAQAEAQEEEEGPTQATQPALSSDAFHSTAPSIANSSEGGIRRKPIRLIIIDSITNNFRSQMEVRAFSEGGGSSATGETENAGSDGDTSMRTSLLQRSADLCETGIRLRTLAEQFNLAVVCVNQVSDVFDTADDNSLGAVPSAITTTVSSSTRPVSVASGAEAGVHSVPRHRWSHAMRKLKPALGLVWENTINTRILLERTQPSYIPHSASTALTRLQFPPPPSSESSTEVHQAYRRECARIQDERERIMASHEPIRVMSVLFSSSTSTKGAWCRYSIRKDGVIGLAENSTRTQ
ncbi:DNA repair protein xrcc3 [Actinomortierella wolfii]|nr:DNA repair protein xrcc3 [Actinomortierella wolfii]